MNTSYSCISPNGFVTSFDTQKRTKYFEADHKRILDLRRWGLSIREVASTTGIPFGSIHYILRKYNAITLEKPKTDISYLDRKQWEYIYDVNSSAFNYAVKRYPHLVWRSGRRVYLHCSYYNDYIFDKKAYKLREEKKRNEKCKVK